MKALPSCRVQGGSSFAMRQAHPRAERVLCQSILLLLSLLLPELASDRATSAPSFFPLATTRTTTTDPTTPRPARDSIIPQGIRPAIPFQSFFSLLLSCRAVARRPFCANCIVPRDGLILLLVLPRGQLPPTMKLFPPRRKGKCRHLSLAAIATVAPFFPPSSPF